MIISIPGSIYVETNGTTVPDEDDLVDLVFDQHGKFITLDARNLGYDCAEVIDS